MMKVWYRIKRYVAGGVAFVICPCHLPITLPLLITLTAGTAFSRWLTKNPLLVGAIMTVAFVGSLALAFRWWGTAKAPKPDRYAGLERIPLVISSADQEDTIDRPPAQSRK